MRLRDRIGAMLHRQRKRLGLTQLEMSLRTGISLKYVGEVERGEANATVESLERLADVQGWDPAAFFCAEQQPISQDVYVVLSAELGELGRRQKALMEWVKKLDPSVRLPQEALPTLVEASPSASALLGPAVSGADASQASVTHDQLTASTLVPSVDEGMLPAELVVALNVDQSAGRVVAADGEGWAEALEPASLRRPLFVIGSVPTTVICCRDSASDGPVKGLRFVVGLEESPQERWWATPLRGLPRIEARPATPTSVGDTTATVFPPHDAVE